MASVLTLAFVVGRLLHDDNDVDSESVPDASSAAKHNDTPTHELVTASVQREHVSRVWENRSRVWENRGLRYPAQDTHLNQPGLAASGNGPRTTDRIADAWKQPQNFRQGAFGSKKGNYDKQAVKATIQVEGQTAEEVRPQIALERRSIAEAEASAHRGSAIRSPLSAEQGGSDAQDEMAQLWRETFYRPSRPTYLTAAEIRATRERLGLKEGLFHCAIAGTGGCGKSSLVNALCGLRNGDKGAAATNIVEVIDTVARFPDPDPTQRRVWYDIPGAGTQIVPNEQYLAQYGLYVFDCIIVVFDTRLTTMDITLLSDAIRLSIPAFLVRSKSRLHIRNLAEDIASDDDDGNDGPDREGCGVGARALERARMLYIQQTRASVSRNLAEGGISGRRVYLVDKDVLVKVAKGEPVEDAIDEWDLIGDLQAEAGRHTVSEVGASGSGALD